MRLAMVLTFAVGCSAASSDPEARAHPTPLLSATATDGDPAVVGILVRPLFCAKTVVEPVCTGTLIAPRVVMTAAHCLENRRAGELRVVFGADASAPTAVGDVDDARIHPSFDATTRIHDLALLRLAKPSTVPPMRFVAKVLEPAFVGGRVRLVGLGVDESMLSGRKRTGTATVSSVGPGALLRYVPGPAMSCRGDSGGPVLFDDGGGEAIIAITRSGDEACAEYGTAVTIDDVTDTFVDAYVTETSTAPTRAIFDRGVDECSTSCASDSECPASMLCLSQRAAGRHCGWPALQSGRPGAPCSTDAECGAGACVVDGDGCRCFSPCTTIEQPQPSSGCVTSGGGSDGAPEGAAWGLLLSLLALDLRARFRKRTFRL